MYRALLVFITPITIPSFQRVNNRFIVSIIIKTDCVFKLRERVRELANEMFELEGVMPPTLERRGVIGERTRSSEY